MIDLKNKKWPSSPLKAKDLNADQVKQFLEIRAAYEKSAFVSEGQVEVRGLGPEGFSPPIPPGECAVSALVLHSNGKIYGGTSGKNAHLFFYDPTPDADTVCPIGTIAANSKVTALVSAADGCVYGAAAGLDGQGGVLFRYKPCERLLGETDFTGRGVREIFDLPAEDQIFYSIVDPCHSAGKIETLPAPVKGEGVADLVIDNQRQLIYGVSAASGTVFKYDLAAGRAVEIGRIDPNGNFSGKLAMAPDGTVYGAGLYGRLFKLCPENNNIEFLNVKAPALKGRELYNRITAWAYDEAAEVFYGGTVDGILFRFDPREDKVICLGKPVDQSDLRAVAVGNDGTVYGVCGEPGKCCHLFSYSDETRELRDLGVLLARSERPWYGYEIACAVTGADGRICLGEADRISHLFMYFPPVKK
ncbi:MAG: hypothetical protein PHV82_14235 [Victivallaceae bacterium]|nr:hypothetical protein [Victivallaceae bacterium]